jgi:hypothetical protein
VATSCSWNTVTNGNFFQLLFLSPHSWRLGRVGLGWIFFFQWHILSGLTMSWVVEFSSWDFDVFTSHAIMLCKLKSLQQIFNMWQWITRKQEDGNWNIIESSVVFWVRHQCSDTKCARWHKVRHFSLTIINEEYCPATPS